MIRLVKYGKIPSLLIAFFVLSSSAGMAVNIHSCFLMDEQEAYFGNKVSCCESHIIPAEPVSCAESNHNGENHLMDKKHTHSVKTDGMSCESTDEYRNIDTEGTFAKALTFKLHSSAPILYEITYLSLDSNFPKNSNPKVFKNHFRLEPGISTLIRLQSFLL